MVAARGTQPSPSNGSCRAWNTPAATMDDAPSVCAQTPPSLPPLRARPSGRALPSILLRKPAAAPCWTTRRATDADHQWPFLEHTKVVHTGRLLSYFEHAPFRNPVQRIPQSLRRLFRRRQRTLGPRWIGLHPLRQLLFPHVRVIYIRGGVQSEVSRRALIRAIHLPQSTILFCRHSRHLRLIRVKRRQRLFRSSSGGYVHEMCHQPAHFLHRLASEAVPARAHAFGKIQPQVGMRFAVGPGGRLSALLIAHVRQHRLPQLAFFQTNPKSCQVSWKRRHVLVVVERILAQILAR